jgi:hypothetical protein
MSSRFDHYPTGAQSEHCQKAVLILQYAHLSASSFLNAFDDRRQQRNARGTATDDEQDLLRAMLLFASAGLDSMVKHLIRDALPVLVTKNVGVRKQLHDFIARTMKRRDPIDTELICALLLAEDPGQHAASQLVNELTASSLQSAEQLLRVGAYFDIPSHEISDDPRKLQQVFNRRNQMAHEMDIDFTPSNRNRRQRAKQAMIDDTNTIFRVTQLFLEKVDAKLR